MLLLTLSRYELSGTVKIGVFFYSEIFMIFFFNQSLEIVDLLFIAGLVFLDQVSRYNKDAVKIASLFK